MAKNRTYYFRNKLAMCFLALILFVAFFGAIYVYVCVKEPEPSFEVYDPDGSGKAGKEAMESGENGVFAPLAENEDVYAKLVAEAGFDSLGGAYYDEEGRLHILKKELSDAKEEDKVQAVFEQIMEQAKSGSEEAEKLNEWVCLENCKYSYNELIGYKDIVCGSSYYSADRVFAVGIDDSANKIHVYAIKGTDLSGLEALVPEDAMDIVFYGEEGAKVEFVDL